MYQTRYIYEHPEGINAIPEFHPEEADYLNESTWYVDIHCAYRSVEATEFGYMYKTTWNSKEDRDKVYGLFPRSLEILDFKGQRTIEAGGSFRFETEEIPDEPK